MCSRLRQWIEIVVMVSNAPFDTSLRVEYDGHRPSDDCRHSRERGNPAAFVRPRQSHWIPAFAGMTSKGEANKGGLFRFPEVPEPVLRFWSLQAVIIPRR
ncbi:hypothetical protein [Lysobacter sp. TAB13]|uniref:hypothetical protein n=1 Tax=Lysobacter sp. TAB13 TaxID=3233065 RepID=UPI003F9BD7A6